MNKQDMNYLCDSYVTIWERAFTVPPTNERNLRAVFNTSKARSYLEHYLQNIPAKWNPQALPGDILANLVATLLSAFILPRSLELIWWETFYSLPLDKLNPMSKKFAKLPLNHFYQDIWWKEPIGNAETFDQFVEVEIELWEAAQNLTDNQVERALLVAWIRLIPIMFVFTYDQFWTLMGLACRMVEAIDTTKPAKQLMESMKLLS